MGLGFSRRVRYRIELLGQHGAQGHGECPRREAARPRVSSGACNLFFRSWEEEQENESAWRWNSGAKEILERFLPCRVGSSTILFNKIMASDMEILKPT